MLKALADQRGQADDVLVAMLDAGPARDAYIDAVEELGEYEQGRALTALVKSERRAR